jgi:multiple antibiotic resistance protein
MLTFEQYLQAIVTVLFLVNPLICGAMFAQIEAGQTRATRLGDATKAALAVLVILVVAALAGARVLQFFGVLLDAFSIAGGGVLIWIGFSMLRGNPLQAQDFSKDGIAKRSLTPLILFAARPGTITGVITVAVVHSKLALPVTALVAVVLASVVIWVVMMLVAKAGFAQKGAPIFCMTIVTRFMGLIVLAMGVQFTLTGFHNFFS